MRWLAFALILTACGPTYKLNKAKRLIAEAVAQGATVQSDTVYTTKTVYVKGDTVSVSIPGPKTTILDTVYLTKERIKIRVKRDTVKELIQVECPPDTVRIQVPTKIETVISPPNQWKAVSVGLMAALFVLLLVLLAVLLRSKQASDRRAGSQ